MSKEELSGGCLCGAVRYRVSGGIGDVDACHCSQCRKQSGHYVVGASVDWQNVTLEGEDNITWYDSSDIARRGFCSICGSGLFWVSPEYGANISAGSLDEPTGLSMTYHIFVADKGDYYDITDDLPQYDAAPPIHGDGS